MDISGADALRVLTLVRELEDADAVGELQERALPGLLGLIPADGAQAYRLSADGVGDLVALSLPQESFHEDPMVIYDHPLDHPLTDVMLETPTPEAWRVSDVAGDRQWQRTHCYNLDFRPFGMRRHLVASAGSDMSVVAGYALTRSGGDFSERERDLFGFAQIQLPLRRGPCVSGSSCVCWPPSPLTWQGGTSVVSPPWTRTGGRTPSTPLPPGCWPS